MEQPIVIQMTPQEVSTEGYMKIKEWNQPRMLRFQAHPDFRGTLKSVTWYLADGVAHVIDKDSEDFSLFSQVGERPEIDVSMDWIDSLGLSTMTTLRIKFEFDTFRMDPVWYAYVYLRNNAGDSQDGADIPYKVKPQTPEDDTENE